MKTINAINLAKLVITIINKLSMKEEFPEILTRLKLLKLLYYIQGYHLAYFSNRPIFNDTIEAWQHGPVVPNVYEWIKAIGSDEELNKQILTDKDIQNLELHESQIKLINEVIEIYNKYSAYGLRDKTHQEEPYLLNYEPKERNIIPIEDMYNYFRPLVS